MPPGSENNDHDDGYGEQEVNHVIGDGREGKHVAWEVDLLDQIPVIGNGRRGHERRRLEPGPREKRRQHHQLVRDVSLDLRDVAEHGPKNKPQQQRLDDRPDEAKDRVLVLQLQFPGSEKVQKLPGTAVARDYDGTTPSCCGAFSLRLAGAGRRIKRKEGPLNIANEGRSVEAGGVANVGK